MRPRDVNAEHAKGGKVKGVWAEQVWNRRLELYGGKEPPKAPPIKEQIGHKPKIKHKLHSPSHCRDCGAPIVNAIRCNRCADHHAGLEAEAHDYLMSRGDKP
jgi:hypothetical protein